MEKPFNEQAIFNSLRGLEAVAYDPHVQQIALQLNKENLHLQNLPVEQGLEYAEKVMPRIDQRLGRVGFVATFSGAAIIPPLSDTIPVQGLRMTYSGVRPRHDEVYSEEHGLIKAIQLYHGATSQTKLDHTALGKGEKGERLLLPVTETSGIEFDVMSIEQAEAITRELYPDTFNDIMQLVEDSERVSTFVCNLSNIRIPAPVSPRHLQAIRQTIAECFDADTQVPYRTQLMMRDEAGDVRSQFNGYAYIRQIGTDRGKDGFHNLLVSMRLLGETFADKSQDVLVSPQDIYALYEGREGIEPHYPGRVPRMSSQ